VFAVTVLISVALVASMVVPAEVQDTISLYGDIYGWLSRFITTTSGLPFDIVVVMKTAESGAGAEFIMTELLSICPGLFKLSTTRVNDTALDLGDNSVGEYQIDFSGCVGAGSVEVVRVQYGDFAGVIGLNVVLSLRGFVAADSRPSNFNGEMGYIDCLDGKHVLAPEPWNDFDVLDPTRLPEVDSADGVMMLNGDIATGDSSIGILKSRF
jgi:hypothetical protein